jgi:hypothetical protein
MKSRLCQIINWAYDNVGQVTSGKRFWQDGTPVGGKQFEYAFDDIGSRKTADRGGDHDSIPNSETLSRSASSPRPGLEDDPESDRYGQPGPPDLAALWTRQTGQEGMTTPLTVVLSCCVMSNFCSLRLAEYFSTPDPVFVL